MAKKKQTTAEQDESARMGEFGSAIAQISDEKGIPLEKVIETIEVALASAYKKDYGRKGQNIRAEFDKVSGGAKFFLVKEVVDETTREFINETEEGEEKEKVEKETEAVNNEPEKIASEEIEKLPRFNPERDIILDEAKKIKKGSKIGDIIETQLEEKKDYGRVAAQTAKQVIIQRIHEAERDSMFQEYKEKEGEVVSGVIQRIEGSNIFVDLGKSVGVLFPSEQMKDENYRIGQRIKVFLAKVESDSKGPGITLSRIHPEMVKKLFELEVPEIFAGTVEIKAISREAGFRTKIAVTSKEDGIDPIGSCVGQKGTRVQSVIDELGGEKIDIIEWSEDSQKFISSALSPAKVLAVKVNEENRTAEVTVPEDQLSLAIGKKGQNVRLAAKLTNWKINVTGGDKSGDEVTEEEAETEDKKDDADEDAPVKRKKNKKEKEVGEEMKETETETEKSAE